MLQADFETIGRLYLFYIRKLRWSTTPSPLGRVHPSLERRGAFNMMKNLRNSAINLRVLRERIGRVKELKSKRVKKGLVAQLSASGEPSSL